MTERLSGDCACGAVRYALASAPMFVHCCHCLDCQRQTGSAFVPNALIETDRVALLSSHPEPAAVPTDSGSPHDIYRCPVLRIDGSSAGRSRSWPELRARLARGPRMPECPLQTGVICAMPT